MKKNKIKLFSLICLVICEIIISPFNTGTENKINATNTLYNVYYSPTYSNNTDLPHIVTDLRGDLNSDKLLNTSDLYILKKYLLEKDILLNQEYDKQLLDINNDKNINIFDYNRLLAQLHSSLDFHVPEYTENNSMPYVVVNNNSPVFLKTDYSQSFENYSDFDKLGRCGTAFVNVANDIMPTEERGYIGDIKPTAWHTTKYDFVDGKNLYNRCHLIGYQLSAENANKYNLITGTRYFNVDGMLPFENMIANYVKDTNNHVLYRVTPVFKENNLLSSGVHMEAYSLEDKGSGIIFNVFCYNIQPGVVIDYLTGDSKLSGQDIDTVTAPPITIITSQTNEYTQSISVNNQTYILNTNTHKFHKPSCSSVKTMKEVNKEVYSGLRDNIISKGYVPCKICNP